MKHRTNGFICACYKEHRFPKSSFILEIDTRKFNLYSSVDLVCSVEWKL